MKVKSMIIALGMIITAASLTSCGDSNDMASSSVTNSGFDYAAGDSEEYYKESAEMESAEEFGGDDEYFGADDAEDGDAEYFDEDIEFIDDDLDYDEPITYDSNDVGAFLLTAGEWNDNNNWGFFMNLVKNNAISFPSYGLYPVNRIAVTLDNGGEPAANYHVSLVDTNTDETVWETVTDKNGHAYLFYGNDATVSTADFTIVAEGAEPQEITVTSGIADDEQGGDELYEYTIDVSGDSISYDKTEVMFILDTTGSMGDELMYLQKDFSAIAEEVSSDDVWFSVNFYKDSSDDYVTRCNDFTQDVKDVQSLLNQESASGGGDTPEAVAEILDETLANGQWSSDSKKIAFLIFDAPPHYGTEEMIYNAIKSAAEKGIKLVPVVASNADRDTELFGRAAAIMTNANYVFLTDDSGIGNSHLEPIIGAYDVELLHDIIVRNIRELS